VAGKLRRDSREKNSLTCDHETRNRRGSLEGREVVSDGSEESDKLREREAGTEKKEGGEKRESVHVAASLTSSLVFPSNSHST